ncbi:hypothetical protein MKW98_018527 [Papaver atlanticum]|uniref:Cationic amino acid transporter C-terminal domain-containing protein n=1 Tax=Papaver atlanticum TaxID=357466 RepID=A0AAD4TDF5_9MAGN|nr:hypothetical protein MKW98_018527 [Papaver atlanticum]
MGLLEFESLPNGGGSGKGCISWGFRSLKRRKQVDSAQARKYGKHPQLAKELSILELIAIGVGSTIGAGVYVLVGTVAREHCGPALTISFLIVGIAAALSAFCYAELACRCPSAGSAYHYSYICVGEGVAWLIGWALILEYTIGGSAVARGISPNLALFFGGEGNLPVFLARTYIPGLDVVVDPCAALLVFVVTGLLCMGIKEVFSMDGMLAGSATIFFAYIGFDSVSCTAEEVKNPQRDLPLGIGMSLSICCMLYMLMSVVIVGLVPYYAMDPDTPISSAFAGQGMQWAVYIITTGAVTALCSNLMGSLLPQPRILMAMARDGLLPSFFSDVNKRTQVPVKSTIVTGICAALLSFFMDVSQLAGMVSVGTLLAFTIVAISILILRYVPPDEVPLSSSLHETIDSVSTQYSYTTPEIDGSNTKDPVISTKNSKYFQPEAETSIGYPLIVKDIECSHDKLNEQKRRRLAAWNIAFVCIGVFLVTSAASSAEYLPGTARYLLCGIGVSLLLCGLIVLSWIDQDNARHSFGHIGGFTCPYVPLLPIASILINVYLLINLGVGTWIRVSVWLILGVFVYLCYGRTHSLLHKAVYVPKEQAGEFCQSSGYLT